LDQVSENLQRTHGYSQATAKEATARAAIEAYAQVQGGASLFGNEATAGARASVTGQVGISRSDTETDSVQAARQALSSQGFSDRVDRTAATYAAESFSQTSTAQNMTAEKISDTFSSTAALTNAAETAESQARTYEQRADYVRSNSATFDTNMNNVFVPFAMDRLVGSRDSYGAIIDEDRAREILAGRTPEDISRIDEIGRAFQQDQADRISVPELIAQNRDVAPNVQQFQPGTVQVLDVPSEGAALREGFGMSNLGRPGEPISEHAPGSSAWQAEREERAAAAAASPGSGDVGQRSGRGGDRDRDNDAGAPSSPRPANDADEPVIRPQFNSALRDQIRASTGEAADMLDSHRPADGRLIGFGESDTQQTAGGMARLARRNAD
jgi:hypothetical protein